MPINEDIQTQRAIDGEANAVRAEAQAVVSSVGTAFVNGNSFSQVQKRAEQLLQDGLLSLESTMHTTALQFGDLKANINLPKSQKFTEEQITKLVNNSLVTGEKLPKQLRVSTANNIARMSKEMARQNALGNDTKAIHKSIIGTKSQGYKDGFMSSMIMNEETLSRTSNKMAVEVASDANRIKQKGVIGYMWLSTLDGRTSQTCQGLHGKRFYYDKSGAKPIPPAHPNCRSTTESIYEDNPKPVPDETFAKWAKENPKELRESMGKSRFELYTDGKLKIERYTDAQFEPITLTTLAKQNGVAFKRASIKTPSVTPPKAPPTTPVAPTVPEANKTLIATPPPTVTPSAKVVKTDVPATKKAVTKEQKLKAEQEAKANALDKRVEEIDKELKKLDSQVSDFIAKTRDLEGQEYTDVVTAFQDTGIFKTIAQKKTLRSELVIEANDNRWLATATTNKSLGNTPESILYSTSTRKLSDAQLSKIETLDAFEVVTNRRLKEHAIILDTKGKIKIIKSGDNNSVSFPIDDLRQMRGHTLSHNHPSNSPLSDADLSIFSRFQLKELRAVSNDKVYSIKHGANSKLTDLGSDNIFKFNDEMTKLADDFYLNTRASGDGIWQELFEKQKKITDKYGLEYTIEDFAR